MCICINSKYSNLFLRKKIQKILNTLIYVFQFKKKKSILFLRKKIQKTYI